MSRLVKSFKFAYWLRIIELSLMQVYLMSHFLHWISCFLVEGREFIAALSSAEEMILQILFIPHE